MDIFFWTWPTLPPMDWTNGNRIPLYVSCNGFDSTKSSLLNLTGIPCFSLLPIFSSHGDTLTCRPYSPGVQKGFSAWLGLEVQSFFHSGNWWIMLSRCQNCMMACCKGWAFKKNLFHRKSIYAKRSTNRGCHHALLRCRKGPCTKTTNKKLWTLERGEAPVLPD